MRQSRDAHLERDARKSAKNLVNVEHFPLWSYFEYYEQSRTHLSLDKDAPLTRAVHPPEMGRVIELPRWVDFTTDTNDGQVEQSLPR